MYFLRSCSLLLNFALSGLSRVVQHDYYSSSDKKIPVRWYIYGARDPFCTHERLGVHLSPLNWVNLQQQVTVGQWVSLYGTIHHTILFAWFLLGVLKGNYNVCTLAIYWNEQSRGKNPWHFVARVGTDWHFLHFRFVRWHKTCLTRVIGFHNLKSALMIYMHWWCLVGRANLRNGRRWRYQGISLSLSLPFFLS